MAVHWQSVNVLTESSFGLTIAYLLPGFVSLWGLSLVSPTVRAWLGSSSLNAPTLGGFLYVTIGSLTAGLILSTVRWLLLDSLHHATGLKQPQRDFSRLQEQILAFSTVVADHYRYYQFYGNMLFAAGFSYILWLTYRPAEGLHAIPLLGFLLLEGILFLGSRDTLHKYYDRLRQILAIERPPRNKQAPLR
jgi:hypothetical protein